MQSNRIKILIVDDSDIILKVLKEYFKVYNVKITTSINGLDGIKKAIEVKPDLILLDLLMPNFDGLKMLQVVKLLNELKNIPVIVISGNTDKINVLSAIEAGADQVLAKPLKKDLLISAVENSLGKTLTLELNQDDKLNTEMNEELIEQLKKLFIENFHKEKSILNESLIHKDAGPLKHFAHNAKIVGKSIGYRQLQKVNIELENLLHNKDIDWQLIQIKFRQLSAIVKDIENSLVVWER
ncbi:transcriptional regulatory protein SrrA [bacterium BMS3Abin03]|nr:transcriptional regulatory protein SrrA [bacterium BMS3Abin03]